MYTIKQKLFPILFSIVFLFISSCSTKTIETKESFEIVTLPDQSEVYLNRNSSIKYDKSFNHREVELEGEAFFSVAKGENPFVVKTDLGQIRVLGTEFSVKTEEEELEVEVEKGLVELNAKDEIKKLKRGEEAIFNKSKNVIVRGTADFEFRSWMHELKIEFKKLGKEIKWGGKKVGKEFKKVGKELKKSWK